jgi:hypothetical protein
MMNKSPCPRDAFGDGSDATTLLHRIVARPVRNA